MDLTPTEEQLSLKNRAAIFSRNEARRLLDRFETDDRAILELSSKARSAGLLDGWIRETVGGSDLTALVILIEELAWGEGSLALVVCNQYLCHRAVQLLRDPSVRENAARRLNTFNHGLETVLCCPDTTEHGSHAAVESVLDAGLLSIDCRKSLIHPETTSLMGSAVVKGDGGNPSRVFYLTGIAAEGARRLKRREGLGLKAAPLTDGVLEKLIEAADVVSRFDDWEEHAAFWRELMCERRLIYATALVGMARAAFEYALDYSKERVAFGKPISQHQAVGFKLADMATGIEAARLMIWKAAERREGRLDKESVESAWLYAGDVSIDVAIEALQVLGGHGYLKLHPVEKWMRDIQFLRVHLDESDFFSSNVTSESSRGVTAV